MSGRNSPFVTFAALAVVVVTLIGIVREGFGKAQSASGLNDTQFANTTAGSLEQTAGSITELLPLLVLGLAAVLLLRTIQ
jgi:hypothetical protein